MMIKNYLLIRTTMKKIILLVLILFNCTYVLAQPKTITKTNHHCQNLHKVVDIDDLLYQMYSNWILVDTQIWVCYPDFDHNMIVKSLIGMQLDYTLNLLMLLYLKKQAECTPAFTTSLRKIGTQIADCTLFTNWIKIHSVTQPKRSNHATIWNQQLH